MNTETQALVQTAIDTVRILAADAVQKANSGHPGTPMGLDYPAWKHEARTRNNICKISYSTTKPTARSKVRTYLKFETVIQQYQLNE